MVIASLRDVLNNATRQGTNPPGVLRNLDFDSVLNIVENVQNASHGQENTEKTLKQDNTFVKGQINLTRFAESKQAIISLFKEADASPLSYGKKW